MFNRIENLRGHIPVAGEAVVSLALAARSPALPIRIGDGGISCEKETLGVGNYQHASVIVSSSLRRVPTSEMKSVIPFAATPVAGDIALARIERIGKNGRVELPNGRARTLHVGDVLAVVFGNRYATNQFEGYARMDGDSCDMLCMGGLCGLVVSTHASVREPTRLRMLGSVANAEGKALRLGEFAVGRGTAACKPHITVVCGTTMDSGKTHTAMSLIRGFRSAGRSVAAIKLTGTGCCRDTWKMHDAGAAPVLDFVDGGFPSTYLCSLKELLGLFDLLREHAASHQVEHIVVEIADGLLQRETAALLSDRGFRGLVDAWVLAAGDPLAVTGSMAWLRKAGIDPVAVSGLVTCGPLAMREAELATGVQCVTADAIMAGALNDVLCKSPMAGEDVA